jgi:hypothetical protein
MGEINGKEINQSITQRTPISRYTIGIFTIFEKNLLLQVRQQRDSCGNGWLDMDRDNTVRSVYSSARKRRIN